MRISLIIWFVLLAIVMTASAQEPTTLTPENVADVGPLMILTDAADISKLAFDQDNNLMGANADTVTVWDLETTVTTQHSLATLPDLSSYQTVLKTVTSSDELIAQSHEDGTVRVWNPDSGDEWAILRGYDGYADTLSFSPDGSLLVTANQQTSTILLWPTQQGETQQLLLAGQPPVAFSPDSRLIVTIGEEQTVLVSSLTQILDQQIETTVATLEGHLDNINDLAFSPDGTQLATASADATISLWNPTTGQELQVLSGHRAAVERIVFSPDGSLLISVGADHTLRLWDAMNGEELAVLEGAMPPLALSPDGTLIATAFADDSVVVWGIGAGVNLPAAVPGHSTDPVARIPNYEAICAGASGDGSLGGNAPFTAYPHDHLPGDVQATLDSGIDVVICHEYRPVTVENCHNLGPGNYSYIYVRKRVDDLITLVNYQTGGIIAQQRFVGQPPPACPTTAERGEGLGDPAPPEDWLPFVLGVLYDTDEVDAIASSSGAEQTNAIAAPQFDPLQFRPLGRFTINGDFLRLSPNGYHVAGVQTEVRTISEEEQITAYWLTLWDIRGGQTQWRVELPDRQFEALTFSPDGSTILAKTVNPDSDEEIRLSFFEVSSGDLISQTGSIDVIDAPKIPGDLRQDLVAEPHYSPDGQYVIVDYWRRSEAPRCAIWRASDAHLLWERDSVCGAVNPSGQYIAFWHPHQNEFSPYWGLSVHDVATGELVVEAPDEMVDFAWIDARQIIIHRPYGEAPIIWNVATNSRAVIELPDQLGMFWPAPIDDQLVYSTDSYTYFWNSTTGRLSNQTELAATGRWVQQGDRLLVLLTDDDWRWMEEEDRNRAFQALDMETGQQLWATRWQHRDMDVDTTGTRAAAYDEEFGTIDFFDLQTGDQLGSIDSYTGSYFLTPDWDWLVEIYGNTYIVWGMPEAASFFDNPPHARLTSETELRYEPNTLVEPAGTAPAGRYVWLEGRTPDGQWLRLEPLTGRSYWMNASSVDLQVDLDDLPVFEE